MANPIPNPKCTKGSAADQFDREQPSNVQQFRFEICKRCARISARLGRFLCRLENRLAGEFDGFLFCRWESHDATPMQTLILSTGH